MGTLEMILFYTATPITLIFSPILLGLIFYFNKVKAYKRVWILSAVLAALVCFYIIAVYFNQAVLMWWIWVAGILISGG